MPTSRLRSLLPSLLVLVAWLGLSSMGMAQDTLSAGDDDPCASLRVAEDPEAPSFAGTVDHGFEWIVGKMAGVLFAPVPGITQVQLPLTLPVGIEGTPGACVAGGTVVALDGRVFRTTAPVLLDDEGHAEVAALADDHENDVPSVGTVVGLMSGPDGATASITGPPARATAPFIVVWLIIGALFFTLRMGFINLRGFVHAIQVTRGIYDNPDDPGEVTHFQALSSALSATVGLGNIAGVAVAVTAGGPGAILWMMFAAFFGMSSKFVEVTLGQKYRTVDEEGRVLGGPMRYLKYGLEKKGMGKLGTVLATVFAVFAIGGSFGGGNMFQANQAYSAINSVVPGGVNPSIFGVIMMVAVGIVILGGIRRIAQTAEMIVPLMVGVYVVGATLVLITNVSNIPHAVSVIFDSAFSAHAVAGGVLGTMVQGFKRAAFSNEAGVGSAAIAHSAAKTEEPIREGLVALLEPFIDTIVVCFATGIVIVVSGALEDPATAALTGVELTAAAFSKSLPWFPFVLTFAVSLFAYSTMISWSYYGERSWTNLFGEKSSIYYKVIFLIFTYVGSVATLGAVIDFSDLMILAMAFPNIFGLYIMSNEVAGDLGAYMNKLKAGAFKRFK